MLDNDETVAGLDEGVERGEEALDVVAVEAGGWFVEENERAGGWRRRSGRLVGAIGAWSRSR